MRKNIYKNNNGAKSQVPIVAVIYNKKKKIKIIESNKPDSRNSENHAEHILIEWLKERMISGKLKNLSLIITTTPCDVCAKKIEEFEFNKIIYLFEKKNNRNNKWKELKNIQIEPFVNKMNDIQIDEDLKFMESEFHIKNAKDKIKSLRRKIKELSSYPKNEIEIINLKKEIVKLREEINERRKQLK